MDHRYPLHFPHWLLREQSFKPAMLFTGWLEKGIVYLVQFHVLRIASSSFKLVQNEMLKYSTRI